MRYRVSLSVLLLALLVSAFSHGETLRVSAEKASLRAEPTLQSAIVVNLTKGELLGVLAKEGYWNKVEVLSTGEVGYIHAALVSVYQTPAQTARQPNAPPPSPPPRESEPPASEPSSRPAQNRTRFTSGETELHTGLGLGLREGAMILGFTGLSMRKWAAPLGFQFDFGYHNLAGLKEYQFLPSVLYSFQRRDWPQVSLLPYAGAGPNLVYQDDFYFSSGLTFGVQIYGGAEVVIKRVPQLALSGEIAHISQGGPEGCGDDCGIGWTGFQIAAHWFFR